MRRHLFNALLLLSTACAADVRPPVLTREQVRVIETTLNDARPQLSRELRAELAAFERLLDTRSAEELLAATHRMRGLVATHPVPALMLVLDETEKAARAHLTSPSTTGAQ